MEKEVADEVVEYYSKYENKTSLFKTSNNQGSSFFLDEKYKVLDKIGQGSYGVVVTAFDQTQQVKQSVAIKKIEKAFDQRSFTKKTLRELKLLRLLKHENIIGLETILLPKSRQQFDDVYCINELMESDLAQIIRSDQELTDDHCKFFIYQILKGLKYIHSAGVIHTDLKPRNLLLNSNCDLKIYDFYEARLVSQTRKTDSDNLSHYVVTRWYRPPEMLLSSTSYTSAVDIWSVGVIFAELMRRKYFLPGSSTLDQLIRTFEIIGTPTEQEIASIPFMNSQIEKFIKDLPKRPAKQFEKLFPQASKEAIDLIQKMLVFDFKKRITVEEALAHPYLADFHFEDDEPVRQKIDVMEFEFENYSNMTRQQYKDLVYEEILLYHYPDFKQQYVEKIQNGQSICEHIYTNQNKAIN